MNSRSQLANNAFANNAEERCRLLSMMVPDSDALGNIVNRSDSQITGRIENLGYYTGGSRPDLFSLDLVSLILRLSSPNFACR